MGVGLGGSSDLSSEKWWFVINPEFGFDDRS